MDLTVVSILSSDTTIASEVAYIQVNLNDLTIAVAGPEIAAGAISRGDFLRDIGVGKNARQHWNYSGISDPVKEGDHLVVTAEDGAIATYVVTVIVDDTPPPPPSEVTCNTMYVTPGSMDSDVELDLGVGQRFSAMLSCSDGSAQNITDKALWETDPAILSLSLVPAPDDSGSQFELATGVGAGEATLVASYNGISASVLVRVLAPAPPIKKSSNNLLNETMTCIRGVCGGHLLGLGKPNKDITLAKGGFATLDAIQAMPYSVGTVFTTADPLSSIHVVKYNAGDSADKTSFWAASEYVDGDSLNAGQFFIVGVTAEDGNMIYYKFTIIMH